MINEASKEAVTFNEGGNELYRDNNWSNETFAEIIKPVCGSEIIPGIERAFLQQPNIEIQLL